MHDPLVKKYLSEGSFEGSRVSAMYDAFFQVTSLIVHMYNITVQNKHVWYDHAICRAELAEIGIEKAIIVQSLPSMLGSPLCH